MSARIEPASPTAPYQAVVRDVYEMDVDATYARLRASMELLERRRDPSAHVEANDGWLRDASDAARLAVRARADYEGAKQAFETWAGPPRESAREALEEDKKAGRISKQITEKMVEDRVAADCAVEYVRRRREIAEMQAACHLLEGWADLWKKRGDRLDAMLRVLEIQRPKESYPLPVRRAARPAVGD